MCVYTQAKKLLGYEPAWTQQVSFLTHDHSLPQPCLITLTTHPKYIPTYLPTLQEALDICCTSMPELRNPLAPKPKRAPLDPTKPIPTFTKAQVAKHSSRDDAWIIVDGKVYDVTEYVDIHPGDDAILNYVGGDSR